MTRIKNYISLIFVLLLLSVQVNGQDSRLAKKYFQSGEYEKSAALYQKLYEKNPNQDVYFSGYISSLVEQEAFKEAEEAIKAQIKKRPKEVQLYVTYGNLYERQFEPEKAEKQFKRAIENLPPSSSIINKLGNAFIRLAKFDLALSAYEKGTQIMNNPNIFAYNLAELYRRKGDKPNMISQYLNAVGENPKRLHSIKSNFQRFTTKEDLPEIKKQTYERISLDDQNTVFPEVLEWVFIQEKDYKRAFRQARSIDKALEEPGTRVFKLGDIAYNEGDYEAAEDAFEYLIDQGITNRYYVQARTKSLRSKKARLIAQKTIDKNQLDSLALEYQGFIAEFGINTRSSELIMDYAKFLAVDVNDLDLAIETLESLVATKSIKKTEIAAAKIDLADYYLMNDNIWDASLLYSQVDKAHREEYIGEVARFNNAKLFYYSGNFEWAQEQFDILKASTSKLISNDAIDLSVFITANLGLDSTATAMTMFAGAELLAVQNRDAEAFMKLDSIRTMFPKHELEDDILYRKAQIYKKQRKYESAVTLFQEIIEKFPEEIKCDNSIYELAEMYELILDQPVKAQELYEKLFLDYSNSTFAVEARKRYRALRGDA